MRTFPYLILLGILLQTEQASAQKPTSQFWPPAPPPEKVLQVELGYLNMDYKPPKHCHMDSLVSYTCGKGYLMSGPNYGIINKKRNIILLFSFVPWNALTLKLNIIKKISPNYDPNKNYLKAIKDKADTINSDVVHYDKSYIRKTSNADDAGEYLLNCPNPYKDKYNHCRVVFLHKKYRGDVELRYFYTDEATEEIAKFMRKTAGILTYRD